MCSTQALTQRAADPKKKVEMIRESKAKGILLDFADIIKIKLDQNCLRQLCSDLRVDKVKKCPMLDLKMVIAIRTTPKCMQVICNPGLVDPKQNCKKK